MGTRGELAVTTGVAWRTGVNDLRASLTGLYAQAVPTGELLLANGVV
jgi:hypothetical protein